MGGTMKILITGGAGLIGSQLAQDHLSKKDSVWVIDNLSTGRQENLESAFHHPFFRFTKADLATWHELFTAVRWADAIYHLAGKVGKVDLLKAAKFSSDLYATERLLEAILERNPHCRLLIASTSQIDEQKQAFHLNDTLSKYVIERLALHYVAEKGLNCVIARIFNTTGPKQSTNCGLVIPRFVTQARAHTPLTVYGTGEQTRSFCDVRDTSHLLQTLLNDPTAIGEIFNVGNDQEISILNLAHLVKKITKSSSEIIHIPYQEAYGMPYKDVMRRRPDLSKVHTRYHYTPQWTLEQTVASI